MAETVSNPKVRMMPGSDSSASYFAFARKGNVVLGIKPYGMTKGDVYGVAGTTYFAARLRSAPAGGLFGEEKVVKLTANPPNLWDAWPSVVWEKRSPERASTTIGVFMKGAFSANLAVLQDLLDQVSDRKMALKMAAYLIELAGPENAILTVDDLADCVNAPFDEIVQRIVAEIKVKALATEDMKASVGVFAMQSAILKKAHDKYAKSTTGTALGANIVSHKPSDEPPDELIGDEDEGEDEGD